MNVALSIEPAPPADPWIVGPIDPARPCSAALTLHRLIDAGRMLRLASVFERRAPGHGNCHAVAAAILLDLADADAAGGWRWVEGEATCAGGDPPTLQRVRHSWIETADGWAIDASSGRVAIADRWWFRRLVRAHVRHVRDARRTLDYLARH